MFHDFKPPSSNGIIGRKSTITSEFVRALIPIIEPTAEEYSKALSILEQTEGSLECSYCGGVFSEWDHFQPIVKDRKPTGHISNIQNLVPSCGKCNQSKGNRHWRAWMFGGAKLSPKTRKIADLNERSRKLELYEEWAIGASIRFDELLTNEELKMHWSNLEEIVDLMRKADSHANALKTKIQKRANKSQ
jgi:5-methylcytosine-specific restriction endonuclease McrA